MTEPRQISKSCPRCQAQNPCGANFCSRCGDAFAPHVIRSMTPAVPTMQCWRRLSHKLTRKDVRTLLGEPLRIEPPARPGDAAMERWEYEYATGAGRLRARGSIEFLAAEGRILTWTEPDWTVFDAAGGAAEAH